MSPGKCAVWASRQWRGQRGWVPCTESPVLRIVSCVSGPLLPQLSSACVACYPGPCQGFLSLFIAWPHPCPNLERLHADPAESLEQARRWGTLLSCPLCSHTVHVKSQTLLSRGRAGEHTVGNANQVLASCWKTVDFLIIDS